MKVEYVTRNENSGATVISNATIILHRRLDDVRSGSGAYLLGLIDTIRSAGFSVRIVVAPVTGFGSVPFSRPAKVFAEKGCVLVWPGSIRIGSTYIATSCAVWSRALRRGAALAWWALFRRRSQPRPAFPSSLGRAPERSEQDRIVAAVNSEPSKIAVAEYSSLAPVLPKCRAQVRAVLLHDLFSFRARSFEAVGLPPDHAEVPLATELGWLRGADLCLYASNTDIDRVSRHLPNQRHIWLPPKVEVREVPAKGPPRAVFLAVRHGGNLDALNIILHTIWPSVHRKVPEAELWIVGEIGEDVRDAPAGVRVLGRVDDMAGIGGADAVGLAPVRAASGVSIKIASYLALGMTALATPKALEGYGGKLDDIVFTAESTSDFIEELIRLLSDAALRHDAARKGSQGIASRVDDRTFQTYLSQFCDPARPEQSDALFVTA